MATILEMMTELQEGFSKSFIDAIHKNDPEALRKAKAKAWQRFLQLGLPTSQSDAFQYLRLQPLFQQHFCPTTPPTSITKEALSSAILDECRESCFVFVNGHFAPELSNRLGLPESIVALQLQQACRTY